MDRRSNVGLAATKLRPPTLPRRLVQRSRLGDALDAALGDQVPLVLASASAGSGKSTLLASWLVGRTESFAWLQIEGNDSDPARFWAYLVESIGQVYPAIAGTLKSVVVGSNGDDEVVVSALVNELSELAEPLVVVIDDYHLVDDASVHAGMERFIDLCPPLVTIVLLTRVDPPFRLGRLRVRNQVREIRGDDLRFDTVEASGLLSDDDVTLDESVIQQLCGRTEGWAAGLVLAGLSLRRSPNPDLFIEAFHGDDQLVVDYMTDEFLAGLTTEHRERLLQTSVLDQFSGALVDAVLDTTDGAKWLHDTAKVNQLLIGLDRTGSWYRYHHLLRDLLRLEAQQTLPDRLIEVHRRAAEWFESEGDLAQAIDHHIAAAQSHRAGQLMLTYGPELISDGQFDTLRGVLEKLGDVATTMAWCTLAWGWCEFVSGRYSSAEDWVEITHDMASADFDQTVTASLRMNIFLGHGQVGSALDIARDVNDGRLESSTADLATVAGGVFMWAGQADEARLALRLAMQKSTDDQIKSTHLMSLIYQTVNEFDAGNTSAAASAASSTLSTAESLGMGSYYRLGPAYAIRGRTTNDSKLARADTQRALELTRRRTGDLMQAYVLTICGDTLIDLGDTTGEALLTEARLVIDPLPDPGVAERHLARIESRHNTADQSPTRVDALVDQLTEREAAVLRYLPTSLSQRDIASELYVSLNTVKTHCGAIYRKLGVSDRKAAVQSARDLDLL